MTTREWIETIISLGPIAVAVVWFQFKMRNDINAAFKKIRELEKNGTHRND